MMSNGYLSKEEITNKVKELLSQGKSLDEALDEALENVGPIKDRIKYIQSLNNISEVRRSIHVANSKKSKATSKENKEKYSKEVEAGHKRMNELMSQVEQADCPLKAMLEAGEEKTKILHRWIRIKEAELKAQVLNVKGTGKSRKDLVMKQSHKTPKSVTQELLAIDPELTRAYEDRVEKADQGVLAINRKVRLLESVK